MDYLQITENFLQEYPDCRHDLANFNEYLGIRWKNSLSDDAVRFLLQGLDADFLVDSLAYHVEGKKYKSKSEARKYAEVLSRFFNYVRRKTDIENPVLYDVISCGRPGGDAYMKRMLAYIDGCSQLTGTAEADILSEKDVLRILEWADAQLEQDALRPAELKKAMAAIGIKMMLVYGITYRELRKIKAEQYDDRRNSITVNGFELRLPIRLAIQMKKVKDFLEENKVANKDGLFFIADCKGKAWGEITSSSGIPDCLEALLGNTSVSSIVKYGIRQLIRAGLNDSVIRKMTGASDRLISGCISCEEDVTQMINNRLVTVALYYRF